MKTHLPTGLRKALIAAIFAVSAAAYNAQAATTYSTDTTVSDIDTTDKVYYDKNIVIDDAATVTTTTGGVKANGITVGEYAALNSHGTVSSADYSTLQSGHVTLETRATLTVENGSVKAAAALTAKDHAAMTVENGGVTAKRIEIDDYSKAEVNGHVTADNYIWVSNRSELNMENGHLSVTDGMLDISNQSHVSVTNGNVTSDSLVSVTESSSLEVTGGNINASSFRAEYGSTVTTDGKLATKERLLVQDHSEVTAKEGVSVSNAGVDVDNGSKLTTEGAITIEGAHQGLKVEGSIVEAASVTAVQDIQLRGNAYDDTPASLIVTGAVTSTENYVLVEGTAGKHSTLKADTVTAKKAIVIRDADLIADTLVRSETEVRVTNGSIKGTADIIAAGEDVDDKNISITDSEVEGASLTALKGNISIKTTEDADAPTTVTLTGDMKAAQGTITVTGAEVSTGGAVVSGEAISVTGGSLIAEGNVIAADGDITAVNADLGSADMTAAEGAISVTNGDLLATGNVSAKENITVTGGDVTAADMTAAEGAISVSDGTLTTTGHVSAATNVTLTEVDASIAGDVHAGDTVSVTKSTLEGANLTADKGVIIDDYSDVVLSESLNAGVGSDTEPAKTIVNNHSTLTVEKDVHTEGLEVTDDSAMEVGDTLTSAGAIVVSSTNGSLTADDITTTKGGITVAGGAEMAATGDITSAKGLSVSGTDSAVSAKDITIADGDILVLDGAALSATGDIKATVTNPDEKAEVVVSSANTSLSAGTLTADKVTIDDGAALEAATVTVKDVLELDKASATISMVKGNISAKDSDVEADHVTGKVTAAGSEIAVEHTIGGGVDAKQDSTVSADRVEGTVIADDSAVTISGAIVDIPTEPGEDPIAADVTVTNAGTVTADSVTVTGKVTVDGAQSSLTVEDAISAKEVTADVRGTIEAQTITAETLTVSGDATVKVEDTIDADIKGDGGTIIATGTEDRGLTIDGDVLANNSTFTVAEDSVIIVTGDLKGNGNLFGYDTVTQTPLASDVHIAGELSGDGNAIYATGKLLNDDTPAISVGEDLSGTGNELTVAGDGDLVVFGDVTGDTNELTIEGDGDLSLLGDIDGAGNEVVVVGDGTISLSGDIDGDGNTLETKGEGDIVVTGTLGRDIDPMHADDKGAEGNTLTAADGDIIIAQLSDNENLTVTAPKGGVQVVTAADALLTDATIAAQDNVTIGDVTAPSDAVLALDGGSISSEKGSVVIAQDTVTDTGSISAKKDVVLAGVDAHGLHDTTVEAGHNVLVGAGENILTGGTEVTAGKNADILAAVGNNVLEGTTADHVTITAENGYVALSAGDDNSIAKADITAAKNVKIAAVDSNSISDSTITSEEQSVHVSAASEDNTLTNTAVTAAKNISLDAADDNALNKAVLAAGNAIHIDAADDNILTQSTLTADEGNITLNTTGGDNTIKEGSALTATAGNVLVTAETGANSIKDSAVEAGETVALTAGTTNTIDNASVTAKGTNVGEGADAITITGTNTIKGAAAVTADKGDITMSDTTTITGAGTTVTATAGDITATGVAATITDNAAVEATAGNVTLSATTNKVQNGASVTAGDTISLENTTNVSGNATLTADTIDVAEGAVVNMGASSADALAGKLAGTGTINAGTDNLNLSYDDTAFTGTVNMGSGKKLTISDKGVGADATINLTGGADMDVTAAASLGHVTAGNGSEVRLNPGTPDGTATASTLAMGAGSTLHIDTTNGTVADAITITESVSIATPGTVYVNGGSQGALAAIAGDTSVTIIKLEDGAVNEGVSEDVKFDMNGTQRVLQNKNMSLVSTKDGVQLVISDNFRSVKGTAANQTAVNDTLKALSAAADHTAGALAASDSKLDNILDALDNTRSTGETKHALQQLSAAGNLVVPNMMMDTTRHHLSTLRSHMGAPSCNGTVKGGNAWVAYTGGHDAINGDGATGDYTRTHQGAILGSDYSVSCNASVGISLGYENSIGRMDSTKAESDTVFADLYTTVKTGAFTHRFSAGVAFYDVDVKRGLGIAAGGHSYTGNSTGNMDAISWNLGYELSYDVKLSEVSTLTPFASVDVAIHQLDTLTENGQGDASVITNYDDPVQVDVAAGVAYTRTFRSFTADSSALSVSAAIHGELSKHRPTADNHFIGGGQSWKIRSSERTPIYGEIGASVAVPVRKTTSVIGGGNFEFSEDRVSVGGNIGVNVKF